MFKALGWLAISIVVLAGCEGSTASIGLKSTEQLKEVPTPQLVSAFGTGKFVYGESSRMRAEIVERNVFTPDQWKRIDDMAPKVGDSELLVFAALGAPQRATDTNDIMGYSRAFYYDGSTSRSQSVIVMNGKVVSMTKYQ